MQKRLYSVRRIKVKFAYKNYQDAGGFFFERHFYEEEMFSNKYHWFSRFMIGVLCALDDSVGSFWC